VNSIAFTLTAEDLIAAQRLHQRGGFKRYFGLVLGIALAIASLLFASEGILDREIMAITLFSLFAVFIGLPLYVYFLGIPRMAKRAFSQDPLMGTSNRFSWDANTAKVETDSAGWQNSIADFACWQANDAVILLYRQTHLYHPVPVRSFPDDESRQSLIDALIANGVSSKWPPR
jgi:heme/copper-type cytochrome/quinol oxidase subunit 4